MSRTHTIILYRIIHFTHFCLHNLRDEYELTLCNQDGKKGARKPKPKNKAEGYITRSYHSLSHLSSSLSFLFIVLVGIWFGI